MPSAKKIILPIVGILLIISILVFVIVFVNRREAAAPSGRTSAQPAQEPEEAVDAKLEALYEAIASGDAQNCETLARETDRSVCANEILADAAHIPEDCARLTYEPSRTVCLLRTVPRSGINERLCEEMGENRELCRDLVLRDKAKELGTEVCRDIVDDEIKVGCINDATAPEPELLEEVAAPPPAPEDLDLDADGLNNAEEEVLGTDPYNPDTDEDGLSDAEEVRVYNTDPLNPDTDGDDFEDGTEVQNGYNPLGPGRLSD